MNAKPFLPRLALAAVSALAFAQSFPPLGWRWLAVPAMAGLLVSLQGQHGTRARAIGFLFGCVAFATSLSWLWNLFGAMSVALWAILAIFPAAFAEFHSRAAMRGIAGWKLAAFTALNWGAWEFIRAEIFPLKLPWMTAGLAIGPNLLLPWIGVYGVSLLAMFAAALLSLRMWKSAAAALAVLLAAVLLSRPHPALTAGEPGVVSMGGVQLEGVSLNEYMAGTRAMPPHVRYVVWPEYAVPFDIRENKRDWNLLLDLCREKDITLTFGTQSRPGGGDEWRNIALTMDASGELGAHTKVHPVHFFDDGTPGETSLPVGTGFGKVGTPICFDCDYEDVVRKMTAAGAELFVVPTMDAESWSARQHDQHAELARMRAAENGRWFFVCATSGVSQAIDPRGHLHARLGALEQGNILALAKRESRLTFYTRSGWLLPWCALAFAAMCWIWLVIPVRKRPAMGLESP